MSAFPHFSNIAGYIQQKLSSRKGNTYNVSKLNAWVRITSGTGPGGLVLVSNPNFALFKGAGSNATGIYGNSKLSGTIGTTWSGTPVNTNEGQGYRPAPIVSSMEIDEGAGNLSRKASFSITAYSKEQMEELCKYFLEPGYSIFIEWGWNTPDGVSGLQSLTASNIANYQSFVNTNKVRENSNGEYDNYLGFMTGGGVTLDGDKWTINVNCTGYVELPSYLLTTETGDQPSEGDAELNSAESYGTNEIKRNLYNPARQRWMRVFNELPETRRTIRVQNLEDELAKIENFIGFDDEVTEKLNNTTDGTWYGGKSSKKVDGEEVDFPKGTKIVSDEKFIKFSALMRIFSEIGYEGYTLAGDDSKIIKFTINTKDTHCSAFPNIYSTQIGKLFVPNPKSPKFKLGAIQPKSKISEIVDSQNTTNSSVKTSDGSVIQFPFQTDLYYQPKVGDVETKKAGYYGFLDDLYVNFNFAKSIMGTTNFYVKDALYQILNGLSSAVNGMWDFQIQETESKNKTEDGKIIVSTELKVHEMNFVPQNQKEAEYQFNLIGTDSIFIDSSFDLDISGAKMNQIIGRRLGAALNGDAKPIPKTLFADKDDLLGVALKKKEIKKKKSKPTQDDLDKQKEENLNILLGKLSFLPKVEMTDFSTSNGDLYKQLYVGAFNDTNIFSALKVDSTNKNDDVSPLMPINFSFSIHGISGIKRGDKFRVDGIPSQYSEGFFQVLSVKHTLDGMKWKTEVTGGFRRQ
jgi:hypothetical protein